MTTITYTVVDGNDCAYGPLNEAELRQWLLDSLGECRTGEENDRLERATLDDLILLVAQDTAGEMQVMALVGPDDDWRQAVAEQEDSNNG